MKILLINTITQLVIFLTAFFLLLVLYIVSEKITAIKRKAKHSKELTELKHNYEQTLLHSQLEIQEETLRNISQEIHDNIGQVLSLAKLQLNTFSLLPQEDGAEVVRQSKELVSKAIADLRSLSKSLNPDRVNELGLEENIRQELNLLERTRQYGTSMQIEGKPFSIPVQTQTILFRIVQEAISNIIKHAEASLVNITLQYDNDHLLLRIRDNGIGIAPEKMTRIESGIGLKNMQSRSGVIGAAFNLDAAHGGGTIVSISLPKPV